MLTYIGDPELTKDQAIRAPTLHDVAHAAGLQCGSVIGPCSNGAKMLDWVIPDSNKNKVASLAGGLEDVLNQPAH